MTLPWLKSPGREGETLTTTQQLEMVRREREMLERRVRLIEDMLAVLRRDDYDEREEDAR
jgi:hypothetical protein